MCQDAEQLANHDATHGEVVTQEREMTAETCSLRCVQSESRHDRFPELGGSRSDVQQATTQAAGVRRLRALRACGYTDRAHEML
jgi:hypothetical protein